MDLKKIFLFGFILCFLGCIAPEHRKNQASTNEVLNRASIEKELEDSSTEESDDRYQIYYALPSPAQIAFILKKSGLYFQTGVICEEEFARYVTSVKKELMFGVYSADLSYCLLNGQRQLALDRFEILEKMSSELGLDKVLKDEILILEFKAKSQNLDSAIQILSTFQEHIDVTMFEQDMEDRGVILFMGAWIEGMYLASKASALKKESELAKRLFEQRTILGTLIRAVEATNLNNEVVNSLQAQLGLLKNELDKLTFLNSTTDSTGSKNITQAELEHLKKIIQEIRKAVIA